MQHTTCNNYITVATGNVAAVKDRPERRTARSAARPTTRLSRRTCHSEVSTRVAYTVSTARFSSVYSQACAALRCRLPLACNARRTAPLNRRQLCLFVSSFRGRIAALRMRALRQCVCIGSGRTSHVRPNSARALTVCCMLHWHICNRAAATVQPYHDGGSGKLMKTCDSVCARTCCTATHM